MHPGVVWWREASLPGALAVLVQRDLEQLVQVVLGPARAAVPGQLAPAGPLADRGLGHAHGERGQLRGHGPPGRGGAAGRAHACTWICRAGAARPAALMRAPGSAGPAAATGAAARRVPPRSAPP